MPLKDFQIHSTKKLDKILAMCCKNVLDNHAKDPGYWGMVGACVLDGHNNAVFGVNHKMADELRDHAEVAAIKNYIQKFGRDGLKNSIMITTLSPCSTDIDQPGRRNCTDFIERFGIKKVYCGYTDEDQTNTSTYGHKKFHTMETRNPKIKELCQKFASTFLDSK